MAAIVIQSPPPPVRRSPPRKMSKTPLSHLSISPKPRTASYQLKEGQNRLFHRLPSGLRMEFIQHRARSPPTPGADPDPIKDKNPTLNPPLVFVHGSFHAAWCWAEHWLPFFSSEGYDCYAVSLLGQGESDIPTGAAAGTLQTHTSDVAHFIKKEVSLPPVLIGHSFGGLIVQSYLSNTKGPTSGQLSSSVNKFLPSNDSPFLIIERVELNPLLTGAVLLCSVPPSGNSGLVWRYLLRKPVAAIKVTLSLAAKAFANSLSLCKETFFSSSMDENLVLRYQELMRESSQLPLFDLKKLNRSLPVSPIPNNSIRLLVMGASDDFIVDTAGLQETANFYNMQPVSVEGVAHDMMLDTSWEKGAEIILSWLKDVKTQPIH